MYAVTYVHVCRGGAMPKSDAYARNMTYSDAYAHTTLVTYTHVEI